MWLQDKIGELLHNLRTRKYQRNKYFRVLEFPGLLTVEILKGSYRGTVFSVSDIKVLDDYGKSKFDFDIVKKIPGKHDSYYGDKFAKLVGEILLLCLTEAQKNYADLRNEVLTDDEDGTDYSEEPVEERTVSAKGSSIPKA
jgi:hypothetical protein